MKQTFLSTALLILFLILICSNPLLSARLIATEQGKTEVNVGQITNMVEIEPMDKLMGVEACDSGDEECLKRRIISEAHLDYIYTQHHNP